MGIREGDHVHEKFKDSVTFNGARYVVELPWKDGKYALPSNRDVCEGRLQSLVKRMKRHLEKLEQCDKVIREQLQAGIVEPVTKIPTGKRVHYIPRHGVFKKSAETTKLRLVYDASANARKNDRSLNDCLYTGPALTPLRFDVLIRFRMKPIALVADVRKAFHEVEIFEKDRDCLRFLWSEDPSIEPLEVKDYRFTRVIFGSAPSPFLLNPTFHKHLELYAGEEPQFVADTLSSFYVDDHVGGANSVVEVLTLQRKLSERMQTGGFELHKWKSNSREVMLELQKEGIITFNPDSKLIQETPKVLGLAWNSQKDILSLDMLPTIRESSKRLNLIGPSVAQGKVAFQQACKEAHNWNSEVSIEVQEKWQEWEPGIIKESQIGIPRCITPVQDGIQHNLHAFADSSKDAYCAAIFLVCKLHHQVYSNIVAGKTRLSPLKKEMSIPQLELTAARIA